MVDDYYGEVDLNRLYELAYAGKDMLLTDEDKYYRQVVAVFDTYGSEECYNFAKALARGGCSYTLSNVLCIYLERFMQLNDIYDNVMGFEEEFLRPGHYKFDEDGYVIPPEEL